MKSKHNREQQQETAGSESNRPSAPSADSETEHHRPHSRNAKRESENNEDDAQNRQFRKINMILMLVFTGALVLVNIIYAYFAGGQWTAMGDSLKETRINRELEYRAYVGAKGAVFKQRTDNPAFADVIMVSVNTGRTPVLNGAKITHLVEPRNEPPPDDTIMKDTGQTGSKIAYIPQIEYTTFMGVVPTGVADILIARAQAAANVAPAPEPTPKGSPTPATITPSLNLPEAPKFGVGYYLYGTIDYKDIFEKPHRTRFCFFIAPKTSAFSLCPTFNDSN